MVLKWICFLLVCIDVVAYIMKGSDRISEKDKVSNKLSCFVGLLAGVAARVYVLYGAGTCWLCV